MIPVLKHPDKMVLSLNTPKKIEKGKDFEIMLDKSFSEKESLRTENDYSKKLAQQKKDIARIEKSLKEIEKETPENISGVMEEILGMLKETMTELEEEPHLDEGMLSVIDTLTQLLEQGLTEIQGQGELAEDTSFMMEKFLFVFESGSLNPMALQKPNILENIINEIQTVIGKSDDLLGRNSLESDKHTGIELSADFEPVEEFETVASEVDPTDTESEFLTQGDKNFQSRDQKGEQDDTVQIFDKRTVNQDLNSPQTVSFTETLESIDSVMPREIQSRVSHTETSAQRAYTSLSSAISRVQVEALMQNVAGKMSVVLQDSGNELRMKLTPPELGQMKLSFVLEDGMMRGKIVVETPEAKMFFEQNIDNLRQSLAHEGIDLSQVDIEMGSQGDFHAKEDLEEQHNSYQAVRSVSGEHETMISRNRLEDTLVDFTA